MEGWTGGRRRGKAATFKLDQSVSLVRGCPLLTPSPVFLTTWHSFASHLAPVGTSWVSVEVCHCEG